MIENLKPGTSLSYIITAFFCAVCILVCPVVGYTITPAERKASLEAEWKQLTQKHKTNRETKADIDQKYDQEDEAIIMQAGRVQAEIMRLTYEANSQGVNEGKK